MKDGMNSDQQGGTQKGQEGHDNSNARSPVHQGGGRKDLGETRGKSKELGMSTEVELASWAKTLTVSERLRKRDRRWQR